MQLKIVRNGETFITGAEQNISTDESSTELMHYGVPGMKWGVKRGRASSAFAKASRKANRLQSKIERAEKKVIRTNERAARKTRNAGRRIHLVNNRFSNDTTRTKAAMRAQSKAAQATARVEKLKRKSQKWESAMKETFKSVKAKDVQQKHLDKGKKYAYMLSGR